MSCKLCAGAGVIPAGDNTGRVCVCQDRLEVLEWEPDDCSGVFSYTDPVTDEVHTCCVVAGNVLPCARCRVYAVEGGCAVERLAAGWVAQGYERSAA